MVLLKLSTMRSTKGLRTVVEACCGGVGVGVGVGFLISGGPRRDGGAIVVGIA